MTAEPNALPLPDWLRGLPERDQLRQIMAAVHRCYQEHLAGGMAPTGPHMTISMAEHFIAQMIGRAEPST